jgi:mono/diheme cytochrome c family protein
MRARWIVFLLFLAAGTAAAQQPDLGTEEQRAEGEKLYDKFCSQCHGVDGDGEGVAAAYVLPRPRDFTSGKYKIRTTSSGSLPTHDDLKSIIRLGMPYSTMPAWPSFTESELDSIAYYLKTFSEDFADPEYVPEAISIPEPPEITPESIEKGRGVYEEIGCIRCHGDQARGDGMSAPTLQDDWGNYLKIADLTKRWTFRGGPTRKDIYRTFSTGLNGTPMPSYYDSLEEADRWDLVNYIYSLGSVDEPDYDSLVIAKMIQGEIDLEGETDLFEGAEPAYFPVVGQVVQPGREFYPSANGVAVRVVYNLDEIAVELTWHDMRAETAGSNAPDLVVTAFEDDPFRGATGGGGYAFEGDDFWGEEEAGEDDFWGDEGEGEAAATGPDQEFSDAVAVQWPVRIPTTIRKPYFIFGDAQNSVELWFRDLGGSRAATYIGRGSDNLERQTMTDLESVATYENGVWKVVFKRGLRGSGGLSFDEGLFVPVAFSIWDGFNRERGNKRGLTQWLTVYLEPGGEKPSPVGPMVKAGAVTLGIEVVLIVLVRRRFSGSEV